MFCRQCGKELPEQSEFCVFCGSKQNGAPVQTAGGPVINPVQTADYSSILQETDETVLGVLGKATAQQYLSGANVGGGFAVLTDRRIYLKGICLVPIGKKMSPVVCDETVDVKNITGYSFDGKKSVGWLVGAIIAFFISVVALADVIATLIGVFDTPLINRIVQTVVYSGLGVLFMYLRNKKGKRIFNLLHTGGTVALDISGVSDEEIAEFRSRFR